MGYNQLNQTEKKTAAAAAAAASTSSTLGFGLKRQTEGYGVIAAQDVDSIERQQAILTLPLTLTLTTNSSSNTNTNLDYLLPHVPSSLWQLTLGLKLLSERCRSASFYQPYIDLLPAAFPHIPLFFTPQQRAGLQYAPIQQQINKRLKLLQQLSSIIQHQQSLAQSNNEADPFHQQTISISTLAWCLSSVSSRAFTLSSSETSEVSQRLIPLLDMINHSSQPNTSVQLKENGLIQLTALREIQPGEELSISYGEHDNDALLLDYGFVDDDNLYESLAIKYEADMLQLLVEMTDMNTEKKQQLKHNLMNADHCEWKQRLLKDADLGHLTPLQLTRTGLDVRLLSVWRLLLLDNDTEKEEFAASLQSLTDPFYTSATHPQRSEILDHCIESLSLSLCQLLLSSFSTTIETDLKQLAEIALHMQNKQQLTQTADEVVIRYRLSKKRVVTEVVHLLRHQQQQRSQVTLKTANSEQRS